MRRARRLERAFWASHSRNWDDSLADERVVDHIEHLSALLLGATPPGGCVVDLGCGTGNHLRALADCGRVAIGADLTPAMLAVARHKVRVPLLRLDLHDPLPIREGSLDGVLSVYAVQFVPLPPLLTEIRRALRTGGSLVLESPRPHPGRRELEGLSLRYRAFQVVKAVAAAAGARVGVVQVRSDAELLAAVEEAGFSVAGHRLTPHSTIVVARRR